jgi:hypothetical protein
MTITYVGAGAAATGNNASVSPALPAGVVTGDLLLALASIRNSGTGTVAGASGWSVVATSGNVSVLGRFYNPAVTAPVITFTGGVANADTIGRVAAFRNVSPDALTQTTSAAVLNASAQNVTYPSLDVPEDAHALLMALWKQDDATSLTTPGGWTAIGMTSTTTGDDAFQAMYYQIQTTEADIVSAAVTVTGGAAAISRGLLLALKPAAAVTVTNLDTWPPRNQIAVTGLTIGDSVTAYRLVAGVRTELRGAVTAATDTAALILDAELPFGVPVAYVIVVAGAAEYTTSAVTYTLTGGKVALSDAITGAAAEVVIGAEGDRTNGRDAARMRVAGRNVVVVGPAGQDEGSYELLVETTTSYDNLIDLLATATDGIVQVRQPGGYDGIDAYLAVDRWSTRRWLQDGTKQARLVTIEFAEVDGWSLALVARGFTLADLAAAYPPPNTLQDLGADYATFIDLAQADLS